MGGFLHFNINNNGSTYPIFRIKWQKITPYLRNWKDS